MDEHVVLRLRLSFKGRPLKSYSFVKDVVTIGRDPESDVVLDNPAVSRNHAKITRTPDGFVLEDLNSANGTVLNEDSVNRQRLSDQDVIRVGKFSIWATLDSDRRGQQEQARVAPTGFEGTTVLTNDQLARVMRSTQDVEPTPLTVVPSPVTAPRWRPSRLGSWHFVLLIGAVFFLGAIAGGALVWFTLR